MKKSFLELLDGSAELTEEKMDDYGEVEEGILGYAGKEIRISHGVPLFYEAFSDEKVDVEQGKTNETFSAKWNVFMRENNESTHKYMFDFVLKRLVPLEIKTEEQYKIFLSEKKMILDAGSGMGWMSEYMAQNTEGTVVSAEIGDGVFAGYEKCKRYSNCHVIKVDLMKLPFEDNFLIIFIRMVCFIIHQVQSWQ